MPTARGRLITIFLLNKIHYTLVFYFFLMATALAVAQDSYSLKIISTDQSAKAIAALTSKLPTTYMDTVSLRSALQDWLLELHGQAYLGASIDTLVHVGREYMAFLHLGKRYQWAKLAHADIEAVYLDRVGYRERLYRNNLFSYKEVQKLLKDLLTYAENNGYPFAKVYLDKVEINGDQISAHLQMNKGPLIRIGSVEIIGNLRLSPSYLSRYLSITEGDLYSRERVLRIRDRLRELPFVQIKSDPVVAFRGEIANINLYVENRSAQPLRFLNWCFAQ